MSTSALKAAVTGEGKKEQKPRNFPALLEHHKAELVRALPSHLKADRMARIALTSFRRNPKLGGCDPLSVFAAVIQASQLGLEIDTQGQAYLVPYKKSVLVDGVWKKVMECQFIPGWKGLVDLTNRAGKASTWTGAVFEGDEFDYALGDRPFIRHKPGEEFDVEKMTHAYSVGRVKGSEWPVIEVWSLNKVKKHLARYNKVGKDHYAFENMEMYARKVVLLQVLKYMPASAEMAAAIALNDAAEIGQQGLNIKDAIEGTWAPVPNEEEPPVDQETGEITEQKPSGWEPTPDELAKIKERELAEGKQS